MKIADLYSHKDGLNFIEENKPEELQDIYDAVEDINFISALSKLSFEKNKRNPLFSPTNINSQLAKYLLAKGWLEKSGSKKGKGYVEKIIFWNKKTDKFEEKNKGNKNNLTANKRSMDGLKNKVGLEIQMGKYSFMGYDIFVKLPIFSQAGLIDCAIEVVFMHSMLKDVSSGVGSFEQCVQELKGRGESNLDIPTLVLGFECSEDEFKKLKKHKENFNTCFNESIDAGHFKKIDELKASESKREDFINKVNKECSLKISMGSKGATPGP